MSEPTETLLHIRYCEHNHARDLAIAWGQFGDEDEDRCDECGAALQVREVPKRPRNEVLAEAVGLCDVSHQWGARIDDLAAQLRAMDAGPQPEDYEAAIEQAAGFPVRGHRTPQWPLAAQWVRNRARELAAARERSKADVGDV